MPNLVTKQAVFAQMIARLILHADLLGFEVTFGDAYRPPDASWGHPDSCHKLRLAVDFNLFIDGKYQTTTEAYKPLGEYWERLGGSWGGRFEDGNHFSLEHEGMR